MNKTEVARLLTIASMIDNRIVAPETVEAWFEILGHLDFGLARQAVEQHFAESTTYLLPAHVIANERRIRTERAEIAGPPQMDKEAHPQPDNWDAMVAAWKDPVAFAAEVAIYNTQLRAGGHPTVSLNERRWA